MNASTTITATASKVAIYARVSTTNHGQDVGLQLDDLHALVGQRAWELTDAYVDDGVSGAKESRPQLDRLMDDARAGRFQVLAVWKLDRLGRSLVHLLRVLDELTGLGIEFVSIKDSGIDTTTPAGRLMLQMLGAFAEFERAMISERVRAGVQRARRQGKKFGRPRREMDLRAAKLLMEQGHSVREVADLLGLPRTTLRRRLKEVEAA
jgi:DNA invertase Pin-like site-specific DNA recombinase